jgi:hypothetical protein
MITDPGLEANHGVAPAVAVAREVQPARRAAPAEKGVEAGLVWAFVKGSIVGFVAVFVLLAGTTLAAGMGLAAALGVGVFTAFWGGPGFGGMMGAVLHYSRTEMP